MTVAIPPGRLDGEAHDPSRDLHVRNLPREMRGFNLPARLRKFFTGPSRLRIENGDE
jgi:hypothetical protein